MHAKLIQISNWFFHGFPYGLFVAVDKVTVMLRKSTSIVIFKLFLENIWHISFLMLICHAVLLHMASPSSLYRPMSMLR